MFTIHFSNRFTPALVYISKFNCPHQIALFSMFSVEDYFLVCIYSTVLENGTFRVCYKV